MDYTINYDSSLGRITLASDGTALIGAWFEGQAHYGTGLTKTLKDGSHLPVLKSAIDWLDRYWAGESVSPMELVLSPRGTPFQQEVWNLLMQIPYGHVTTYKAIAISLASSRGMKQMSAQAIGSAISRNPISIIIPCHRVIGSNGNRTGYAGGICRKQMLLQLEGHTFSFLPYSHS